jgi:hypothetical protein
VVREHRAEAQKAADEQGLEAKTCQLKTLCKQNKFLISFCTYEMKWIGGYGFASASRAKYPRFETHQGV